MSINISDHSDIKKRAEELGLNIPTAIAFIPRNFTNAEGYTDLIHEGSVSTLRKLFRQESLPESRLDPIDYKIPYCHENAFDWIAPILFFSATVMNENPHAINIACGIIANYVTDFFRGIKKAPYVKLNIIVETTKTKKTKKIAYEGSVEGIGNLAEVIKEVACG
jgi:hypothetical protein